MSEHDRVIDLLTWFVNGTLDTSEQRRVLQHIEQCSTCRHELELQQRVRDAIAQPSKVEFAPQTSFNKLWDRINVEDAKEKMPSRIAVMNVRPHRWPRLRVRWMPLALATQLLVIIGLLIVLVYGGRTEYGAAAYRTVTTNSSSDVQRPIIHVVFDDATRLSDVKDILSKAGIEVVSGPTNAGVYSLTPERSRDRIDLNELVASLRADPRVRFAELSHP